MISDKEWADIQAEGEGLGWVFVIGAEGKSFITSVSATRLDGTTRTEQEAQEIAKETARRSFLATFGRDPNSVRAKVVPDRGNYAMPKKSIILVSSDMTGGMVAIGPFDNAALAEAYMKESQSTREASIITLLEPVDPPSNDADLAS